MRQPSWLVASLRPVPFLPHQGDGREVTVQSFALFFLQLSTDLGSAPQSKYCSFPSFLQLFLRTTNF